MHDNWFKRKGNIIIGLSKAGIAEIIQGKIDVLEFPETIGDIVIKGIEKGVIEKYIPLVPTIRKIIFHKDHTVTRVKVWRFYEEQFNKWILKTPPTVKEITIQLELELNFRTIKDEISDSLEKINILDSRYYSSVDGVIFSKDKKKLIYFPRGRENDYYIPGGTETIGEHAFEKAKCKNLSIPASVRTIESCAFEYCETEKLYIPDTISNIEACAFEYSRCKQVRLPLSLTEIKDYSFQYSTIEVIDIPSAVKLIGKHAFDDCKNLKKICFHEGLMIICREAFRSCSADEIVFPKSLQRIESEAFACSSSSFVFQSETVVLHPEAFHGCTDESHYSTLIQGELRHYGYPDARKMFNPLEDPKNEERKNMILKMLSYAPQRANDVDGMYFNDICEIVNDYETAYSALEYIRKGDFQNPNICSALTAAIKLEDFELLQQIATEKVVGNISYSEGYKLYKTCKNNKIKYFNILYDNGLPCNWKDELLDNALLFGDSELCRKMLEQGIDPMRPIVTQSPYHYTGSPILATFISSFLIKKEFTEEQEKICNYLIDNKKTDILYAKDNLPTLSFLSVVFGCASFETQKHLVDKLIEHNEINHKFADIDYQKNITPIELAIRYSGKDSEIVKYMKTFGEIKITYKEAINLNAGNYVRIKATGETGYVIQVGKSKYSGRICKYIIKKDKEFQKEEDIKVWYYQSELEKIQMEIILK